MSIFRRRKAQLRNVAFCDGCGQVCTPACRAQARYRQVRDAAATASTFR